MKTKIIKEILINFEKDDKELIEKVIALINNLITTGNKNNCDCYEINSIYHEREELEGLVELLADLVDSEVIELT